MGTIINEFEILPGPAPKEEASAADTPASAQPSLTPEDVQRIEERQRQRLLRLWAD